MPAQDRIAAVMASPSTSFWLKASLDASLKRDPLDALRDAELLVVLLSDRLRQIQGRSA